MKAVAWLLCLGLAVSPGTAVCQTSPVAKEPAPTKVHRFFTYFDGGLAHGDLTLPAYPQEDTNGSPHPATGYMFGLGVEAVVTPSVRLFLDGTTTTRKVKVADQNGYATSFWVYEQTGYSNNLVGPFPTDVYGAMDATGFRLGLKYVLSTQQGFELWGGIAYGLYRWTISFDNSAKDKTYGSATGMTSGPTYLAGVDAPIGKSTDLVLYADVVSPVANPQVDNLFNNGWTWVNAGGNNVMGPYRAGLALRFAM